jgi:TolB-like protein
MRCLEKDPAARYQNAYEILADLQGSQSGSGVSRHSGSSIQIQLPEFASRRWVPIVGGIVAVVILALAIPPVRHLILGGGGKGGTSSVSGVPPLSSGRFVAVLPLQILGDASQLGYVAQGIEEALSAKLFQLKDVRVAPSEAADKADQKQPLQKIARTLGANLLVQGTLQAAGDKIRIIMKLEDVADGKRLLSQEWRIKSTISSSQASMSTRQMMSVPQQRPGRPTTSLHMICIYGGAIPCAATTAKAFSRRLITSIRR